MRKDAAFYLEGDGGWFLEAGRNAQPRNYKGAWGWLKPRDVQQPAFK
jgi:hypothetical protein